MPIRKLPGTATADAGVFWDDKVNHKGWRIQYNHTLDVASPLKPFRLLDPKSTLWASADTLEEMVEALPRLCEEFSAKEPLFDSDDARAFGKMAIEILKIVGPTVIKQVIKTAATRRL